MKNKLTVRDITYSALLTAIICVLGYIIIPIPFSPVAITGQSLAVMLAGCLLTPLQAGISMISFLFLGCVGVPVFSGGRAGIGILVGQSGGYYIGYLIGAVLISVLARKSNSLLWRFAACFIGGIVIVHFLGAVWLGFITNVGIKKSFILGSLPFIPGDLLKAVIAVAISSKINKGLRRN